MIRYFKHILAFLMICISNLCHPIYAKTTPILRVEQFGAKGDSQTNDTKAINSAILAAAKTGRKLYFRPNVTYIIDSISLSGEAYKAYKKLQIIGNNSTIKCIDKGKNNVLNFFFIDTLIISNFKILGNKTQKTNGSGIGVYYSKYVNISGCFIQNSKYCGILIAWVKLAHIGNNRIFNNGDGSLPTDGISIHSLMEGTINSNVIYNNNPIDTQDGDGIQIGGITYGINNYYEPKEVKTIKVTKNICYKHGRRGIKIQRSNVLVSENFLSENAIGVSVVNGEMPINNIQVNSNVIQKSYKGITTDGGGKLYISNVSLTGNYLLGSIMTDRIRLEDVSGIKIDRNSFDKPRIKVYDVNKKDVHYLNVLASPNVKNIDSSRNSLIDIDLKHLSSTQKSSVFVNIVSGNTDYKVSRQAIVDDDVFCVFNNAQVIGAKINIYNKGQMTSYNVNKNGVLVIYSFNNKLLHFLY